MRWILLCSMMLILSMAVFGHTKVGEQAPSYEGLQVGSVAVVANPHLNAEQYRPLITQQAGEPFSKEKIQESIDALKRTQAFSKVDLKVEPGPDGLKLSFVLEPAYYIGMLEFPEAIKHF